MGATKIISGRGKTVILSAGAPGPQGPAGPPGGVTIVRKAAQALGGHRVARALANDEVDYASSDQLAHADLIVGLTTGAANAGADVNVQIVGEIEEGSWSWTLGPVFLGLNGQLTQTPPASGFIRQIGVADAPDRLVIDLRPPFIIA